MKRRPLILGGLAVFLCAQSLGEYSQVQTARVTWETWYQGAAYSTPTPRDVPFSNSFASSGYSTVGGPAYWRADGITCTWAVLGANDGGSNSIFVDVLHEDGGIDCEAEFVGACASAPGLYVQAGCLGGTFAMLPGSTYKVQLDAETSCITVPAQMHCTVDLFR